MCGENASDARASMLWVGSSPRVRGKLDLESTACRVGRLIPACAGKTSCACGAETG